MIKTSLTVNPDSPRGSTFEHLQNLDSLPLNHTDQLLDLWRHGTHQTPSRKDIMDRESPDVSSDAGATTSTSSHAGLAVHDGSIVETGHTTQYPRQVMDSQSHGATINTDDGRLGEPESADNVVQDSEHETGFASFDPVNGLKRKQDEVEVLSLQQNNGKALKLDGSNRALPDSAVEDDSVGHLQFQDKKTSTSPMLHHASNDDTPRSTRVPLSETRLPVLPSSTGETADLREPEVDCLIDRPEPKSTKDSKRPAFSGRTLSTPVSTRRTLSPRKHTRPQPLKALASDAAHEQLRVEIAQALRLIPDAPLASPTPDNLPLPPLSLPIYLQLELSSHRPSQTHIRRAAWADFPYESSKVKIERLVNFLLLPFHLEGALLFGTLACFDAWLYTFTILPLRLMKSFYILGLSWTSNLAAETRFLSVFVYQGGRRVWRRRRTRTSSASQPSDVSGNVSDPARNTPRAAWIHHTRHHRRAKSVPSMLLPDNKADILRGCLIICTCLILLRFDASRMYHWIRGQATIKLYVIYNLLEVCDRLLSAIGQDILECLFSRETLERKPNGHSKVLRPLWLFFLGLVYTTIHSTALFYQVITLNVAVNSYSNALITLLLSNQFVEIKGTVFKKFEKENLFQLTCADVVERFQIWLMLIIIASRNVVETGGLSRGLNALNFTTTLESSQTVRPNSSTSIFPSSFTLVPDLVSSLTTFAPAVGQVLAPFFVVLGSEMLVDWIKHAYINKFNNTRPAIYGRYLDVLAKDYYSNAFADQDLTKRLGLPVIPLSCLFIRATVQTYQMLVAVYNPPLTPSPSTSLASIHEQFSASRASLPTSTAVALSQKVDELLRRIPSAITSSSLFTNITTILALLLTFLVLLALKLVLGMFLLSFARSRYRSMKEREKSTVTQVEGSKRVGGWGVVEVDDDKRRWIYEGDTSGLRALKEKQERGKMRSEHATSENFDNVSRYEMAAKSKRIW